MAHHYSTGFERESRRASVNLHYSCLPPQAHQIYAVAAARIYHSQFSSKQNDWSYSGLRGLLVFGRDRDATAQTNEHWFRLIDDISDRVIWLFKIPSGFVYEQDRPFFYTFSGMSRKFGFLFGEDDEAMKFAQQVVSRVSVQHPPVTPKGSRKLKQRSPKAKALQLSPSIVASPTANTFVHVSHIGMNADGLIEHSKDLDPTWSTVLSDFTNNTNGREDAGYISQPEPNYQAKSSPHNAGAGSKPSLTKKSSLVSIWKMRRMRSTQQTV